MSTTTKLCLVALAISINAVAQDCQPVLQAKQVDPKTWFIATAGKHCLKSDIVLNPLFDIHAGRFKSLAGITLLKISHPKHYIDPDTNQLITNSPLDPEATTEVDLQGHTIRSKVDNVYGISQSGGIRRISVRNGVIDVPGNRNSIGIRFGNDDGDLTVPNKPLYANRESVTSGSQYEDFPSSETLDKRPPSYRPANYLVEGMTIRSGWRGVEMAGGGNVLRNNTIEVDGHTAIYMYGPGCIIENNTIIVRGTSNSKPFDAAIKLRDARGAIVRNNHIIYKGGWFAKAPAAFNLLDSTNVHIEGNTIEGFANLVRVNGESNYVDKDTVIK